MATITGFTSARMQEIVDDTIVNAYINEVGHLILVKFDATEVDAGAITTFLATTEAAGGVELATNLETMQGLDNQRAVTPAGLASLPGYKFQQRIKYTTSFTFEKAVYADMRLMRVITVGGGGAGGGAQPASAGNHSKGGGGGGGGYAERIVWPHEIADAVTITVGAGGVGSTAQAAGASGGSSSFGTLVVATGGAGGNTTTNQSLYVSAPGGDGGVGTAGDILIAGAGGGMGTGYATLANGGNGGSSVLGGGARGTYSGAGAFSLAGYNGGNYGAGGSGALANQSAGTAAAGGSGAPGIVIVEVYV